MPYQTPPGSRIEKQKQYRPLKGGTAFLAAASLLLGGLLFYAGFRYMDHQFALLREDVESRTAVAVAEIHQSNSARIDLLVETLVYVTAELDAVKRALEAASLSVSASASAQERLQRQLEELERQLSELQRAIELLQEIR